MPKVRIRYEFAPVEGETEDDVRAWLKAELDGAEHDRYFEDHSDESPPWVYVEQPVEG